MYALGPTAIQHLGRRQFLALYLLGGAFSQRESATNLQLKLTVSRVSVFFLLLGLRVQLCSCVCIYLTSCASISRRRPCSHRGIKHSIHHAAASDIHGETGWRGCGRGGGPKRVPVDRPQRCGAFSGKSIRSDWKWVCSVHSLLGLACHLRVLYAPLL